MGGEEEEDKLVDECLLYERICRGLSYSSASSTSTYVSYGYSSPLLAAVVRRRLEVF